MKSQKRKYPASLFWMGVAVGILRSFFLLLLSAALLIAGMRYPLCAALGLTVLAGVIAVVVAKQLLLRHTTLHSVDEGFSEWQNAILSPDWRENVREKTEEAIRRDRCDIPDGDPSDEKNSDGENFAVDHSREKQSGPRPPNT